MNIVKLDLYSNAIDNIDVLSKVELPNLKELNLNHNCLGNTELWVLSEHVLNKGCVPNLRTLNLKENNFNDEGVQHLSSALDDPNCPNLVTVNLGDNPGIQQETLNRIEEKLQNNRNKAKQANCGRRLAKSALATSVIVTALGIVAATVMVTKFKMLTEGVIAGTICCTIAAVFAGLTYFFYEPEPELPAHLVNGSNTTQVSNATQVSK